MNIFFYIIIAVIGTIFGSFFTLATYRIPKKEDITHTRSYCPNCNHRLEFWDLIPVLSYLFLGGKCRYCKEPINARYILLELLSGAIFVAMALSIGLSINSSIDVFIQYIYFVLILTTLCIVLGIGRNINISVVLFGILIRSVYLLCFNIDYFIISFMQFSVFLIVGLLIFLIVYSLKKYNNFALNFLKLIVFISFLVYVFNVQVVAIILSITLIVCIILKLMKKENINYVLYISLISIVMLIIFNNDVICSLIKLG